MSVAGLPRLLGSSSGVTICHTAGKTFQFEWKPEWTAGTDKHYWTFTNIKKYSFPKNKVSSAHLKIWFCGEEGKEMLWWFSAEHVTREPFGHIWCDRCIGQNTILDLRYVKRGNVCIHYLYLINGYYFTSHVCMP